MEQSIEGLIPVAWSSRARDEEEEEDDVDDDDDFEAAAVAVVAEGNDTARSALVDGNGEGRAASAVRVADMLSASGALPSPRQVGQIQQDFILEPAFVRPTHP